MLKFNLGCGAAKLDGYENVDIKSGGAAFPLNAPAGTVDEIRASHVLEHFPYPMIGKVLANWHNCLRPGGMIKISVPDLEKIARAYLAGQDIPVQGYLMGGRVDEHDIHGTVFDREMLTEALNAAGFVDIRRWASGAADCSALPVSLNLAATKRGPLPLRVAAVMSVPRLGFMDNFQCTTQAAGSAGIPFRIHQGVFWGQCLTRGIEETIKDGFDAVITVDYDSVFTRDDLLALVRLMTDTPEASAILAMQQSRFRNTPLMTMRGLDGKARNDVPRAELERDLVPVATGHFGLTILRGVDMARVPRPWFQGQPDGDGRWGEDRVDDDVYFWRQMEAAGLKAYLAPRVVIGHMELMVRWPDMNLESDYQMVGDYRKTGKPDGVWQ